MRQKSNHNYTIWDGKIGLCDRLLSLIPRVINGSGPTAYKGSFFSSQIECRE